MCSHKRRPDNVGGQMTSSDDQRTLVLRLLVLALAMSVAMSTVTLWALRRLERRSRPRWSTT